MKDQLSALDVSFLVKELQQLKDAKIEKVFGMEKPEDVFLFSLHSASLAKSYLYVSFPGIVCLASFKPDFPSQPPHFVASLRRKITNARIQAIEQIAFERIIKITLSTKQGLSYLYIELLVPGNMVLTDETGLILATRHHKTWSATRDVRPGKIYSLPEQKKDPRTFSQEEFSSLLRTTDKTELVKFFAIDCSLGGVYAEELLLRSTIDKTLAPQELSLAQQEVLYTALQELFGETSSPTKTLDQIFPFTLKSQSGEPCESFAQAISTLILAQVEKQEQKVFVKEATKVKNKFERIIYAQRAQLTGLEEQESLAQKQGECIYANYANLSTLLLSFQEDVKKLSSKEVQNKYLALPFVKEVNLKEKTLTVEVPGE